MKDKTGKSSYQREKLAELEKMATHIPNYQAVAFCQRGQNVKRLVCARALLWYTVNRRPILLVISQNPKGKEKDDFFFTTEVTMKTSKALTCCADHWAIEDTFKNTKHLLIASNHKPTKAQAPNEFQG